MRKEERYLMKKETMERMRERVRSREDTYGFLAGIFREELTAEQIKEMIDSDMLNLMVDAGCSIDCSFLRNKSVEHIEEELACEYAVLFIGPGEHIPPYESIYVPDSTGKVGYYWGECTVDMKNWVEHYGVGISERFESLPDHISIQLEFMQKVIEQERLAWERGDTGPTGRCIEVERTFFHKHINKWVPAFCDRVMQAANLDFYREVARLTRDFIQEEERLLNGEVV
jgi:TorA maturation chaperone TorD